MSTIKELASALEFLAETMSQVDDGAGHLTCTEARSIEDVLRLAGFGDAADSFIECHAHGDDDIEDDHHARYRELHGMDPLTEENMPGSYGILPVPAGTPGALTCGTCGKSWTQDITPAGRCPWEYDH